MGADGNCNNFPVSAFKIPWVSERCVIWPKGIVIPASPRAAPYERFPAGILGVTGGCMCPLLFLFVHILSLESIPWPACVWDRSAGCLDQQAELPWLPQHSHNIIKSPSRLVSLLRMSGAKARLILPKLGFVNTSPSSAAETGGRQPCGAAHRRLPTVVVPHFCKERAL